MSSTGLIDSLLPVIDSILGVRDQIGAVIKPVYFLTRTWDGERVGDGTATDVLVQMLPSPGLKEYTQARTYAQARGNDGGYVKGQELVLTGVSKNSYPLEDDVRRLSTDPRVEKFYVVGTEVYVAIGVNSGYLTWEVQVRRLSNQTRY